MSTTTTATATATNAAERRTMPAGLRQFVDEVLMVASALLNPRRMIAQVEAMQALYLQANTVEAQDPLLAARLREQASRIGLR